MKGIVFTEFSELVEEKFSPELLDEIIDECDLPSGGAYTSVGTYDHNEIVLLVGKLSQKTGIAVDDLIFTFGEYLAGQFSIKFPDFFNSAGNVYEFMKSLDNHIHVEVKKLYPDADLPKFTFDDSDPESLVMVYQSPRGFASLAHGLMHGVIGHYREPIDIDIEPVVPNEHVIFRLNRNDN